MDVKCALHQSCFCLCRIKQWHKDSETWKLWSGIMWHTLILLFLHLKKKLSPGKVTHSLLCSTIPFLIWVSVFKSSSSLAPSFENTDIKERDAENRDGDAAYLSPSVYPVWTSVLLAGVCVCTEERVCVCPLRPTPHTHTYTHWWNINPPIYIGTGCLRGCWEVGEERGTLACRVISHCFVKIAASDDENFILPFNGAEARGGEREKE